MSGSGHVATAFVLLLLSPTAVLAGPISHAAGADPLLDPQPGPCAKIATAPDYVAGTDAMGYPVVPADVGAEKVPIPEALFGPTARESAPSHGTASSSAPGTLAVREGGQRSAPMFLNGKAIARLLDRPSCQQANTPAIKPHRAR